MIRFANNEDVESIIKLWNEAFGDSETDIRFFLDNRFVHDNTLVICIDGEVVSMLFLLEGNFILGGVKYPSYYLYAACTAKNFRGRGLMAELLNKAKSVAAQRNKFFICLMPGEKSLFDFYEKFGYKTVFSRKILTVNTSDLLDKEVLIEKSEDLTLSEKRNRAFSQQNFFEWDDKSIDFACKHHLFYGGNMQNNCKGYSLYTVNDSDVIVKEFAFTENDFESALKNLVGITKTEKSVLFLPADYETAIGEFEIINSAMAVPVKPQFDYLISDVKNAYLGLTLD